MMEMIAAFSVAAAIVCGWGWYQCNQLLNRAHNIIINLAIEAGHMQKVDIDKENLH